MKGIRRTDRFIAYMEGVVSSADYQTLTLFYQPVIGVHAFTLYMTLMNLLDRQNLVSQEYFHGDLESLLNRKLDDIETDRFRLEAIGLMNSYYLNEQFLYELKLPMSAQSFVNDGVLGQYLIASITKDRFKKLVQIFKFKMPSKKLFSKITKSFDEVFPALHLDDELSETDLRTQKRGKQVKTGHSDFDWRLFETSIPEAFFDSRDLTETVRTKIENIHYVYGLDEIELREVFIQSIDEEKHLNLNKLAVMARENYKENHRIVQEKRPEEASLPSNRNLPSAPIEYFKAVSPRALLEEMGGGKVSAADLRIVERLLEEVGLDRGVLNVLLAYVAKIKEGNLPGYDYFEKVALGWKRNQVNTVETAIDYVKHLSAKYGRNQEEKASKPNYKGTKAKRPDVEIDWLDDYIKSLE